MLLNKKVPSCENVQELMFDYIDGTLNSSQTALIEAHTAKCEACERELGERKELLSLIKDSPVSVPSELYGRVMTEVEKTPQNAKILKSKARIKPWMSTAIAACAAIVILVAGRGFLFGEAEMLDVAAPDVARSGSEIDNIVAEDKNTDVDAEKVPSGEIAYSGIPVGGVDTDMVFESTDAYSGYSPSHGMMPANPGMLEDSSDMISTELLDGVFETYKSEDGAILVCAYSDVADVLPEGEGELSQVHFGIGTSVIRYVVSDNADVVFTGYINLLEALDADFRMAVPEDAHFSSCEIFIITDVKE